VVLSRNPLLPLLIRSLVRYFRELVKLKIAQAQWQQELENAKSDNRLLSAQLTAACAEPSTTPDGGGDDSTSTVEIALRAELERLKTELAAAREQVRACDIISICIPHSTHT
jgi:aspartyl/asparaginyl beta-hydroxylase (cupin superfamily)